MKNHMQQHLQTSFVCFIVFESQLYHSYKMSKWVILLLTNTLLDLKDDDGEDQALKATTSSNVIGRFHCI